MGTQSQVGVRFGVQVVKSALRCLERHSNALERAQQRSQRCLRSGSADASIRCWTQASCLD